MKTNKILMALALPALFAACTAEEIEVASVQQNTLQGRALLDPNFAINVAEGAESRFAWENMVWSYEDGDKFGAAVVDPAALNTISSESMLGNYIFSKNEAGEWKTTSQMSEGTYLYYSFDGFEAKASRSLLAFDFRNQKANLKDADAELNKYENQLFVSPLYKLVPKYSAEKLPLTFYSFAGVGAFPMTNNSGQDLKITQIILRGNDGASTPANMIVKGYVNPNALAATKYEYHADSEKYVPSTVAALLDNAKKAGETVDAEDIEAAYTAVENTLLNTQAAVMGTDGIQSNYITLDCQNYLLKDGQSVTPYMMIPAGMTNMSVEIMVVDEEGEAWSVYVKDENDADAYDGTSDDDADVAITGMKSIKTKRDKTNAIFGKTNDNKAMKSIKIKSYNLKENSGYYVDSKKALIELLDGNLGSIKVHNSGDWAIDKDIVKAILNYSGAGIQFTNPIEIKSTSELTAEEELALKGVTFADVTVVGTEYAEDKETVTFAGTTADLNVTVNGKLVVEEGANVTIIGGSYKNIENYGTLAVKVAADKVNVGLDGTTVNKKGTMSLYNENIVVTAEAGTVKLEGGTATAKKAWTIVPTLNAGANLEIGANVTVAVPAATEIKVNADATLKSKWTNNGVITGEVINVKGQLINNNKILAKIDLFKDSEMTNSLGATAATVGLMNATLTNNGVITNALLAGGLITTGVDSETVVGGKYEGKTKINNTNLGVITEGSSNVLEGVEVYYNFSGTVEELEGIAFSWFNINTLRIDGTATFARNFKLENCANMTSLKKLVLAEGSVINVKTDKVVATFNEIEAEGNAEIKGIKGVSELVVLHELTQNYVNATIYNEAVASNSTQEFGHILAVKNIKMTAKKQVDATTQVETAFAIKSLNDEVTTSLPSIIPALVNMTGSFMKYLSVDNTTANVDWKISVDGADAAAPATVVTQIP